MAGPVHEALSQQQATKRSAEADPEPSPVTKRPAEEPKPKQQEQPLNATAASEQQQPEPAAENQSEVNLSEVNDGMVVEHPPSSVQSDAQTKEVNAAATEVSAAATEVNAADHVGSDLAAVASKLADAVNAVTEVLKEAQKVAKIAEQAAVKGVPAEQNTTEPVVKESAETNPAAPQESVKPMGADLSTETQSKDTESQAPAPPTVQKSTEAVPEKGPEVAKIDNNVNVDVKLPLQKPDPVPDTVFPPPLATLTPANPLPQTASTPLIGNIPPQAVESLKAAAQEAASILPLQPTQELLEQQASIRTTPLAQPVDQGAAPMEE